MTKLTKIHRNRRWRDESGFTLIELVVTIMVVSIITGVVSVSVDSVNEDTRISNAVTRALSDLRYAQEMAMTHRRQVNVAISPSGNHYAATWGDTGASLPSPMGGGALSVTFGSGQYHGVSITSGISGTLSFTSTGEPLVNGSRIPDTKGRSAMLFNNRAYISVYRSGLTTIEKTVGGGGCAAAC